MVWFQCDDCGDSIKKPKLQNHFYSCSATSFTCIDCSRQFGKGTVQAHVSCVTEHEKYALGATKPGGYAVKGCFNKDGQPASGPKASGGQIVGMEHLPNRPPWKCSLCGVSATSQETLHQHAQGSKHVRRAKAAAAAAAAANGQDAPISAQQQPGNGTANAPTDAAAVSPVAGNGTDVAQPAANGTSETAEGKKGKKDKKSKRKERDGEQGVEIKDKKRKNRKAADAGSEGAVEGVVEGVDKPKKKKEAKRDAAASVAESAEQQAGGTAGEKRKKKRSESAVVEGEQLAAQKEASVAMKEGKAGKKRKKAKALQQEA